MGKKKKKMKYKKKKKHKKKACGKLQKGVGNNENKRCGKATVLFLYFLEYC